MNVDVLNRNDLAALSSTRLGIADCDIHPRVKSLRDLDPWLSARWRDHLSVFGLTHRQPYERGPAYPKAQPMASRRDAWPPDGGAPGSDLAFMALQHLDPNNVAFGILNPLTPSGQGAIHPDLSGALTHAVNHWQVECWTSQDNRLKASIVVPYEDTVASVREIEYWAGNPNFAQVLMLSRTGEPPGQRRYWPIYEAACAAGLPVAFHAFGHGGHPVTAGGWPSYYIEDMVGHAQSSQAGLVSLVVEGVLERLPDLKIVIVEAGFAWAPALMWRLDRQWRKLKLETPHLTMSPSEYFRRNVWFTSQPMEEPEPREHVQDAIGWIGWDRLLFATDYPHWDFDDPAHALPIRISDTQRQGFFMNNARTVYGLGKN